MMELFAGILNEFCYRIWGKVAVKAYDEKNL